MRPIVARWFEDYAADHRHPMNRLTHKIAIPMIVFQSMAMLDWVRIATIDGVAITLAFTSLAGAALFYLWADRRLGLLMTLLFAACIPLGRAAPPALIIAIAVVGWTIQLVGHAVYEKNRPSFTKNLLQTLVGPLFFVAVLLGSWPEKKPALA